MSVFVSEHPFGPGDTLAEYRDVLALSPSTIWYNWGAAAYGCTGRVRAGWTSDGSSA